jgi:hypothetical protein
LDVLRDTRIEPEDRFDLRSASDFVSEYWRGFCREAADWLIGSGISKLTISGKLHATDLLVADW